MVDQSELAFRLLCRKHGAQLCYTPMLHAGKYVNDTIYRENAFRTCKEDRPLVVQFCANDPETFTRAAHLVEPLCDGVDLNLGCPQVIAKTGHYGAYLQDNWTLVTHMIQAASQVVRVPLSCKIRVLTDHDRTVHYAQMLEQAGCKWLTVHGRTRDAKGSSMGLADWDTIKAIKANVSIPVIANGNILDLDDIHRCLAFTGCDAVMSAEGLLHNPLLFSGLDQPVWEVAASYLDLCRRYPTNQGHIRTHLFRIYAYCLPHMKDLQSQLALANNLAQFDTITELLKDRLVTMAIPRVIKTKPLPSCHVSQSNDNGDNDAKQRNVATVVPVSSMLSSDGPIGKRQHLDNDNKSGDISSSEYSVNVSCQDTQRTTSLSADSVDSGSSKWLIDELQSSSGKTTSSVTEALEEVSAPRATVTGPLDRYRRPMWLCHCRPTVYRDGVSLGRHDMSEVSDSPDTVHLDTPNSTTCLNDQHHKLSKTEKRKLRFEHKLAGHRLRRKQRKEERRGRKTKASGESLPPSGEECLSKRDQRQLVDARCREALVSGQRVCVDLSMEQLMTSKEKSRLAQQLGRLYGANRGADKPLHVYFVGLDENGFLYEECVRKHQGFRQYMVDMTSKQSHELFPLEDIVYLTPDSSDVLRSVEADKVYVIGGLVDETVQKNVTKEKAQELKINTARLPIEEFLVKSPQGTYKKVLSVNQVFQILLSYTMSHDWAVALSAGVPARTGFVVRAEPDK
ncbi:tRNA-dihydrouridine(16/17) synthase [NAD(P)(+)]-like [Lamellibrachia satsuma]|nr:tRNA-dihydrouridine(16/17) synthase [NAD(P)(+)]-like [Lamellibrachia satsuma]